MTEYTILASHPTKGLITVTVLAETAEEAAATLEPGCIALTISARTSA